MSLNELNSSIPALQVGLHNESLYNFSENSSTEFETEYSGNLQLTFFMHYQENTKIFQDLGYDTVDFFEESYCSSNEFNYSCLTFTDSNVEKIHELIKNISGLEITHIKTITKENVLVIDSIYLHSKVIYDAYRSKYELLEEDLISIISFRIEDIKKKYIDLKKQVIRDKEKLEKINRELSLDTKYIEDFREEQILHTDSNVKKIIDTVKGIFWKKDIKVEIFKIQTRTVDKSVFIERLRFRIIKK